jgi:hypothetical protein
LIANSIDKIGSLSKYRFSFLRSVLVEQPLTRSNQKHGKIASPPGFAPERGSEGKRGIGIRRVGRWRHECYPWNGGVAEL